MENPCHKDQIKSLKRIEGQVRGIQKMIDNGKYCMDILNQIRAVKGAITTVEGKILKTHLKQCIKDSLVGNGSFDDKVDELVNILSR